MQLTHYAVGAVLLIGLISSFLSVLVDPKTLRDAGVGLGQGREEDGAP